MTDIVSENVTKPRQARAIAALLAGLVPTVFLLVNPFAGGEGACVWVCAAAMLAALVGPWVGLFLTWGAFKAWRGRGAGRPDFGATVFAAVALMLAFNAVSVLKGLLVA